MPNKPKNKKGKRAIVFPVALLAIFGAVFIRALPIFAQTLGETVNSGFDYATIVGWSQFSLKVFIMRIIQVLMGFLGILAIVVILYGGFVWMTSGGSEEKVAKAKRILVNATIGLFLILAAFAIASFILRIFTESAEGVPGVEVGRCTVGEVRPCSLPGLPGCYATQRCNEVAGVGVWGACEAVNPTDLLCSPECRTTGISPSVPVSLTISEEG